MHVRSSGWSATALLLIVVGCGADASRDASDGGAVPSRESGVNDARTDVHADARGAVKDSGVDARKRTPDAADVDAAAWAFAPTLPIDALQQNNTSACGGDAGPCTAAWDQTRMVTYSSGSTYAGQTKTVTGFWDNGVPSGAQAPGSTHGYVSKVPVSTLLPGETVPIWVETQNWWGGGSGHITNGEVSSKSAQMANQVADHISRGFAGQVVDWYGPGTTADLGLPFVQASAEASGGAYQFAVMIDKALFVWGCGETVGCLNSSLSYIATHYGTSPAYLKDEGGHPIVFYFVNEYYPTEYGILTGPGVDAAGTVFEMYEPNGFPGTDPANTIGEYAWVNPQDGAGTTMTTGSKGTFGWATDFGFKDLNSFFSAAASNQTAFLVSEAHKGFDDNLANWSLNRIVNQQCGMTWLETFSHTGSFGGSASFEGNLQYLKAGKRLDFVMVDTWDDYEEGSGIETGIDNCMSDLNVSLSGTTLSWAPTWGADPMNAAVMGSEATVYEYSVYVAEPGGANGMWLRDLACTSGSCPHSLDVSQLGIQGGPYVFYVQAVGQPSIVNHLAGPTTATYTKE